mmetsp:Transcript_38817/g.93379  ORF Transcript_38817/g.93379 Transcript_38817/m.93379 type:complete len:247 (+) Transcript_38817:335-1075(+)
MMRLQKLLLLLLGCTQYHIYQAYTYEPPGRDPASIDKVRSSEKAAPLTTDNFDELTKGKLVFIKFYAPYCPHCKDMAGAWNELATYYQELPDNDNILIGSIDCTDSPKGKELCARFKIMGLPTLLYGDASLGAIYLEEYGGDKTFEKLKSFAVEALVPKCNPGNLDACAPDTRKDMEAFMGMSYHALDEKIKGLEQHEKDLKTSFKNSFAELQRNYDQSLLEKEMQLTRANANVKLLKEVIALKKE